MTIAFLAPLALGGCASTQNSGSSSYEKKKSDYESNGMSSNESGTKLEFS